MAGLSVSVAFVLSLGQPWLEKHVISRALVTHRHDPECIRIKKRLFDLTCFLRHFEQPQIKQDVLLSSAE